MNNGTTKILVVDDDSMMRLIAGEVLEQDGFTVAEMVRLTILSFTGSSAHG